MRKTPEWPGFSVARILTLTVQPPSSQTLGQNPSQLETWSRCVNVAVSKYADVRYSIADGDVLLFRHKARPLSWGIARFTRSDYSHAGIAGWLRGRVCCLETHQRYGGGRIVLLRNLVKRLPGKIDVYRCENFGGLRRAEVVDAMVQLAGQPYGWGALLKIALKSAPVIRLIWPADTNDNANGSVPVCSAAVSRVYRMAGIDLVPNLADSETTPGDLSRSKALKLVYRLGV